jgi:hypothetical protein
VPFIPEGVSSYPKMIDRTELPRDILPHGEFRVSDLPDEIPDYSGDLSGAGNDDPPREAHLAFAIAVTNVDRYMAFADAQRDTLDALAQAWRAVAGDDVKIEYSRSATSVEKLD